MKFSNATDGASEHSNMSRNYSATIWRHNWHKCNTAAVWNNVASLKYLFFQNIFYKQSHSIFLYDIFLIFRFLMTFLQVTLGISHLFKRKLTSGIFEHLLLYVFQKYVLVIWKSYYIRCSKYGSSFIWTFCFWTLW